MGVFSGDYFFFLFLAVGIKGKLSRFPYYYVVGCNLNSIMHI